MKFKNILLTFFFGFFASILFSQSGSITGVVIDKKTRETLVGASVVITGTINGAITDFDGKYAIQKLKPGTYDVTISFVAYTSTNIKGLVVADGKPTILNVQLESGGTDIKTIEVTAEVNRQSSVSLMSTLQTSVSMASGISQETIRRSPDRNVGEVLKRVSGVSVNENKFVIIRGLGDRYNFGMLNNLPLASTEPDRKTIAFDIFPANVIDNIIVSKTATPDLPGEFAGGVVQINTRDVPYENSYSISVSGSENSQSTFEDYYKYGTAKTNWLGQDAGDRKLPSAFPDIETFRRSTPGKKAEYTNLLTNDWTITPKTNLPINRTFQLGLSQRFKLFNNDGGIVISGTHNTNYRMINVTDRNDFDSQNRLFHYRDTMFNTNISSGLLANLAYKIGKQGKFTFKNLFSTNSLERSIFRAGINDNAARLERANSNELTVTNLYTAQARYEHSFIKSGIKLSLGYSFTNLNRDVPNLRKMLYTTSDLVDTTVYYAQVPFGSANPALAGKFYSHLNDYLNTLKFDVSIPLDSARNHTFKAGVMQTKKDRTFNARVLGYVLGNPLNYSLTLLPQDSLFMPGNIDVKKFRIDDITNPTDKYTANFNNQAAYVMADNLVTSKLRFIYGVRYEKYTQELFAKFSPTDSVSTNTFSNLLPSVNIIYTFNEKHKLRAAYSQTVSRPEFREIAPFAFYDFIEVSTVLGNDSLVSATIENVDLKYEFYPKDGQVISLTGFYKKFKDPIETIFDLSSGGGSRTYTYSNVAGATNIGVELDFRLMLSSINALANSKFCNNFTVFSNITVIKSKLDLSNIPQAYESERPLQGQSPYIVNIGLDYRTPKSGWGATLLYNKIGNRVVVTGSDNNPDIIQAAREQLDFSISKKFLKYGEARLVLSDILNRPDVFYQDLDKDGKYIAENDNLMRRFIYGYGTSLSILFKF
nr:TonB-dependent receptor [Bacteroidota bacterium]